MTMTAIMLAGASSPLVTGADEPPIPERPDTMPEPWGLAADALRSGAAEGLTGEVVIEVTKADGVLTARARPWPPVSP